MSICLRYRLGHFQVYRNDAFFLRLILSGDAFAYHRHGIKPEEEDEITKEVVLSLYHSLSFCFWQFGLNYLGFEGFEKHQSSQVVDHYQLL